MPGTIEGGRKAAITNKKSNENFYREIGAKGGAKSRGGGFAKDPELARRAGAIGGRASRRRQGELL